MQCDELWGFVYCKEAHKPTGQEQNDSIGDAWCYVAIERYSKLILAWHLGRRTARDTLEFTERIREATEGRFQLTRDGFNAYPDAVSYSLGMRVDFAQLVKVYAASREGEQAVQPRRSRQRGGDPTHQDT